MRELIIRGGENVYPAEIENLLLDCKAVETSAVFAFPDAYYGETVAAAVCLCQDTSAAQLRSHMQQRIAGFKIPEHWYRVDELHMTANGKVRKNVLRERGDQRILE